MSHYDCLIFILKKDCRFKTDIGKPRKIYNDPFKK